MPMLFLLWILYLSLFHVGQVFLSFQWDILLLEAGFLAIFLPPIGLWLRSGYHCPRLAIWLVWWLLFRLMFESGAVKLTWNDSLIDEDGSTLANSWETLTAMEFHYWTQPLPIWTSWYADKSPSWSQSASVVGVLIIELGLAIFIFGPRLTRYLAFAGITLLMLLISSTGNYNFFNLLTVVLALTLLDDSVWQRILGKRLFGERHGDTNPKTYWRHLILIPFAAFAVLTGSLQVYRAVRPHDRMAVESYLNIDQFCFVNDYGLFRRMTETRPEIVIEVSMDGKAWREVAFRWKPGDLSARPRWCAPHQPRLDWQMWFEALRLERVHQITGAIDPRMMSPWFQSFLLKLLDGEPSVVRLLADGPIVDNRPIYVRMTLYQYRFTTSMEGAESGNWWHRRVVWQGPPWQTSSNRL
jgi:hypothetical protein